MNEHLSKFLADLSAVCAAYPDQSGDQIGDAVKRSVVSMLEHASVQAARRATESAVTANDNVISISERRAGHSD